MKSVPKFLQGCKRQNASNVNVLYTEWGNFFVSLIYFHFYFLEIPLLPIPIRDDITPISLVKRKIIDEIKRIQ